MCILKFFKQVGEIEYGFDYVFCADQASARQISAQKIEEGFVVDVIAYDYVSGM